MPLVKRHTAADVKRLVVRITCVLLLLVAQQSALLHAAGHADHARAVQNEDGDKGAAHTLPCDLDSVLVQVLGGASGGIHFLATTFSPAHHSPVSIVPFASGGITAVRARGPPVFA